MARNRIHATMIVGAGFTGLGAAIKLREAGVEDIVILERSDRVGGTWRDTGYPGASCDIPSLLYSFSFVKNPNWSRTYSPAAEICRHLEDMATEFDVRRHIRFGQQVSGLSFDESAGVWTAKTTGHTRVHARTVVLASGPLPDSGFPDIRGIDSYRGHTIHSARWDHDYDFTGRRVAVIGTGASAIQIIPELVKQAGFVKVFQRTPGWVLPRLDVPTPPGVQNLFATGYDVHLTGPPFPVSGLGARSLSDDWADGAQAYKSINAHGYPNLFFMTGPNSGPGHNSLLVYIEGQLYYAVRGITTILGNDLRYLDVRADVQRRYNERIQKRLTRTTWMSGCRSWYLTKDGFNASMFPGFATQYLRQMADFRFADYDAVARPADVRVHSSA